MENLGTVETWHLYFFRVLSDLRFDKYREVERKRNILNMKQIFYLGNDYDELHDPGELGHGGDLALVLPRVCSRHVPELNKTKILMINYNLFRKFFLPCSSLSRFCGGGQRWCTLGRLVLCLFLMVQYSTI